MAQEIKLEKFQGPLDLLLQLIEQEKLSITEVSLSKVTEQYFQHLSTMDDSRSEELADFLVIATKLVYLKSRQLLPYLYPLEAEEGPSLEEQLELYKRYADASKHVAELWNAGRVAYGRVEPPAKVAGFVLPLNAQTKDLHGAFTLLLSRLKPIAVLPQVSIDRGVSVRQKIEAIHEALKKLKRLSFKDLVSGAESKTEVIVSFLAILELVKAEKASVQQGGAFGELLIKKV